MNIREAFMSPTPNTTFLRDEARFAHLTQESALCRSSEKAEILASGASSFGETTGLDSSGEPNTRLWAGAIGAADLCSEPGNGWDERGGICDVDEGAFLTTVADRPRSKLIIIS